jgi:hypothetical protein
MGLKLVPLAEDAKTPAVSSTNEIYNDSNYWTQRRLEQESYRFKNVATTYGKTHIKDEQGRELYLCELDIDSDEVFTRLSIVRVKDKEYFFIDEMCKMTYVVRTRKKNGYRIDCNDVRPTSFRILCGPNIINFESRLRPLLSFCRYRFIFNGDCRV